MSGDEYAEGDEEGVVMQARVVFGGDGVRRKGGRGRRKHEAGNGGIRGQATATRWTNGSSIEEDVEK